MVFIFVTFVQCRKGAKSKEGEMSLFTSTMDASTDKRDSEIRQSPVFLIVYSVFALLLDSLAIGLSCLIIDI